MVLNPSYRNVLLKAALIMLLSWSNTLKAQVNDMGVWTNIYLEKKVYAGLHAHFNQETRFNNNVSQFSFAYGDIGLTYKITSFLSTTLDYVLVEKYHIEKARSDYYSTRHQFYYNIVFRAKANDFKFMLREQVDSQVSDFYSSDKGFIPEYHWRHKFTVKYELTQRFTPYVADEVYYQLGNPEGNEIDRNRTFFGTFYKLSKHSELELYYLLQLDFHQSPDQRLYVIGLGYAHEF